MRSENLKVNSFHAIALSKFLTQKNVFQSEKVLFGRQNKIMVGVATGSYQRNFDWVRANGSRKGKSGKSYPIFQANGLIHANSL